MVEGEDRIRSKRNQWIAGHMVNDDGDEGDHLFARIFIFGGSPNFGNLVPMLRSINRSEYKKLENFWARELNEGKKVFVDGQCIYEGDSMRPVKFIVSYIIDGIKNKVIINNR